MQKYARDNVVAGYRNGRRKYPRRRVPSYVDRPLPSIAELSRKAMEDALPINRVKYNTDQDVFYPALGNLDMNHCTWYEASLFPRNNKNPWVSAPPITEDDKYTKYLLGECTLDVEVTNQCTTPTIATCYYMIPRRATDANAYTLLYAIEDGLGIPPDAYDTPFDSPRFPIFFNVFATQTVVIPAGTSHNFKVKNDRGMCAKGKYIRSIDFLYSNLMLYQRDMQIIIFIKCRQQLVTTGHIHEIPVKQATPSPWAVAGRSRYDYSFKRIPAKNTLSVTNSYVTVPTPETSLRVVAPGSLDLVNPQL